MDRPPGPLRLGLTFALAAAAAELLLAGAQARFGSAPVYRGWLATWSIPLVYVLLILPVVLGLAAWRRARPGDTTDRWAAGLLAAVAIFYFMRALPRVHSVASAALALGVGVQVAQRASRDAFGRAIRRIGAAAAAVLVLAGATGAVVTLRRPRTATPAAAGAPNVLFIILDTVRSLSIGAYGRARPVTPTIDSLARSGARFARAVAPAPWTLPSHATLFTGRWPWEHQATWRQGLDTRYPTLAELFRGAGYRTGGFVSNLIYCTREHGLQRGFDTWKDYAVTPGAVWRSAAIGESIGNVPMLRRLFAYYDVLGRKHADDVGQEFLDWQAGAGSAPWFAVLNFNDAHEPYLPPPAFAGRFGPLDHRRHDLIRLWKHEGSTIHRASLNAEEQQAQLDAYEEALAAEDNVIGALLDALRRRGALANTLVIVTADHGEQFGEHGFYTHGNTLYGPALDVPLVLAMPGRVPAGAVVNQVVSLRDVPATITALVLPAASPSLPGTSLAGLWSGTTTAVSPALTRILSDRSFDRASELGRGDMAGAVTDAWRYIRHADGRQELYDHHADPAELHNLAADPARAAAMDSLRAEMTAAGLPALRTRAQIDAQP